MITRPRSRKTLPEREQVLLTVSLGATLFDDAVADAVQSVIREVAPIWSASVVSAIDEGVPDERENLDLRVPSSLGNELRRDADRGLVGVSSSSVAARRLAHRVLLGAEETISVLLDADDRLFAPLGAKWAFGNEVTFVARQSLIEGRDHAEWIVETARRLARATEIWYAAARTDAEFDAKNRTAPFPRGEVIGTDISRSLPGLYWLNYFGSPYVSLIGASHLLNAPSYSTEQEGSGVLVRLAKEPTEWQSKPYLELEEAFRRATGSQFFFSKATPDSPTQAPAFGLGPLPMTYPRQAIASAGYEVRRTRRPDS